MESDKNIRKIIEGYSILKDVYSADKERARKRIFDATIHRQSIRLKKVLKYAAIIFLPIVCSLFTYKYSEFVFVGQSNHSEVTVSAPMIGTMKYFLPDSSCVWLASGSTITYKAGIAGNEVRDVTMTGKCFFDVKHDSKHPFIVNVGEVSVIVKGTKFNSAEIDGSLLITLVEGAVVIENKKGELLGELIPNQQYFYDRQKQTGIIQKIEDCRQYTAWMDGELYFNRSDLQFVKESLEQTYDIVIEIQNKELYEKKVTANFKNEKVEEVVAIVATILGGTCEESFDEKSNKKVYLIK